MNKNRVSKIVVGSTNPVKINSIVNASSETWPEVSVIGFDAPSGISDQPRSDKETKTGAINRAQAVLQMALDAGENPDLAVGLEGGIFEADEQMWSTVWIAVLDTEGNLHLANGARFVVPEIIASIIRQGEEMGPVMAKLVNMEDVRKKQGMIGVITNGFVDRTEEYTGIAKMALGLWYGQNWAKDLI